MACWFSVGPKAHFTAVPLVSTSCRRFSSSQVHLCHRHPLSKIGFPNYSSRCESTLCCRCRLDQKASRSKNSSRAGRNSHPGFSARIRRVAGWQQIARRPERRKSGRPSLYDSHESGWSDRFDAPLSQGSFHQLSRGRAARRWLAFPINLDPDCGWARGKADVLYVADAFQVMEKLNALLAERAAELQAK